MLTRKVNIDLKEENAKEYVKEALKKKSEQLVFTAPDSTFNQFHIINKFVIQYFVNNLPFHNNIHSLNLNTCELSDQSMEILSKGNFKQLKELHLYKNLLTGRSLLYLKRGSWKSLKSIDIGQNPIKQHLNERQFMNALPSTIQQMLLQKLSLDWSFFQAIRMNEWKKIRKCYLSWNNICNHAIEQIIACDWPELQLIDFEKNLITNDGMKTLRKGIWPKLQYLYLKHNPIDDKGIEHLIQNGWSCLKTLNLSTAYFLQQSVNIDIEVQVCLSMAKWLSKIKPDELSIYLFYAKRYDQRQSLIQNMVQAKGITFL